MEKKYLRCLSNNLFPGKKVHLTFPLKFVGVIQIEFGWLGKREPPTFRAPQMTGFEIIVSTEGSEEARPLVTSSPSSFERLFRFSEINYRVSLLLLLQRRRRCETTKNPRTLLRRDRRKLPRHSTTFIAKTLIVFAAHQCRKSVFKSHVRNL